MVGTFRTVPTGQTAEVTIRPAALVSLALVVLLSTGCSDDEPAAGGDPTDPSPSSTLGLCDAVSAAQLSGWAGRPVTAGSGATESATTECRAASDDGSILVTWQTQPAAETLDAEVARASADGLERSSITVAGSPAALLVGSTPGIRHAKVVLLRGDESLYVDVGWLAGVGPTASFESLRSLAVGVAEKATA